MFNQVETRGRTRVEDIASKLLHSLREFFSTIAEPPKAVKNIVEMGKLLITTRC